MYGGGATVLRTGERMAPARRLGVPARPHLLLVVNGHASGAARVRRLEHAHSLLVGLGAMVESVVTDDVQQLAEAVDPERRLVVLGGDGSLHALANLPGPLPEVALIPAGAANNIARSLGIPSVPELAARLALEGRPRPLDLLAVETADRRYNAVEGVSVGFLAMARTRYRGDNSADVAEALRAAAAALSGFRAPELALESDGRPMGLRTAQLFAANLPRYGPRLRVAPAADPRDGLMDVVALPALGRGRLPAMLARLRRGTHLADPGASTWRAGGLRIDTGGRSPIVADSTDMGTGPASIALRPGAMRLVAP
jgi:diacylglycerol kinase (ATP)